MKTIKLTKGQVAIVDDADFEWLSQWKWYTNCNHRTQYAIRNIILPNGKQGHTSIHREILGLVYGDPRQGDHIDGNGLNCQRYNLRIVTRHQNQWNHINAKGYRYRKSCKRYAAEIRLNKQKTHLGYFDTALEAHTTYLVAKGRLHVISGYESHDYITVGAEG